MDLTFDLMVFIYACVYCVCYYCVIISYTTTDSSIRGESEIEKLVTKLEERYNNRIPVTFSIRKEYLKLCRSIAKNQGSQHQNRIQVSELYRLRDLYADKVRDKEVQHKRFGWLWRRRDRFQQFGIWDQDYTLLQIFEKAIETATDIETEWFYFRDFNFYYMVSIIHLHAYICVHPFIQRYFGAVLLETNALTMVFFVGLFGVVGYVL